MRGIQERKKRKDTGEPESRASKKDKALMALVQKDTLADQPQDQKEDYIQEQAQWNNSEGDVSKPISFERHMSKSTKPHNSFYNNDFYYLVNLSTREKYATSLTKHFATRLSLNDIEDMYLLKLQVESYERTLNLTKPKFYFEGINQKIPYTVSGTEKGIVYLNQHNIKSLMKLIKVNKFCEGTFLKIHDKLLKMVSKNELAHGNKRLKRRDSNDKDIKRSNKMLEKIDQTLKHMEQLRRLEEAPNEKEAIRFKIDQQNVDFTLANFRSALLLHSPILSNTFDQPSEFLTIAPFLRKLGYVGDMAYLT
nr:hypothetical protein [Tanacetum cinerariifolium]